MQDWLFINSTLKFAYKNDTHTSSIAAERRPALLIVSTGRNSKVMIHSRGCSMEIGVMKK